jgi:hypothetical protein
MHGERNAITGVGGHAAWAVVLQGTGMPNEH